MAKPSRKQAVLEILQRFRGMDPLKELFWQELNYDRADVPVHDELTERQKRALVEQPTLWATAGTDGRVHVIYSQFDDDNLLLTKERLVVNKLLQEHPYALFIFSNKDQDLWHFVTPEGRSVELGLDYLLPYVVNPDTWPKPQITPVPAQRRLAWQVAAVRLDRPDFIEAMRHLPVPESNLLGPLELMPGALL